MKQTDFLVARLGSRIFCIEIRAVRQIVAYQKSFRVPKSPAVFSGIIHVKGGVVPIVDLSVILGIEPIVLSPFSVTVVTELARFRCGFVFDAVEDIVPRESMPDFVSQQELARNGFIEKTVALGDEEAYIIDIHRMMTLVEGACTVDFQKEAV